MSKRILLLTGSPATRPDSLNGEALRAWLGQLMGEAYEVTLGALTQLEYYVGTRASIRNPRAGYDLADFDLVVFRTVGKQLELAIAAATYLHAKGVPFTDPYLLMNGKGKLACSFIRWAAGLPVPETIYTTYDAAAVMERYTLAYPVVVKADISKKGRDNYLAKDTEALTRIIADANARNIAMIIQPRIPNEGDFRVLVIDGKSRLALLRQADGGTHLNNVSTGARAVLVPLHKLPKGLKGLAERAAQEEKLTVAGVDIIIDQETQQPYILEVNRAPQIPTGAFAAEKMEVYAETLRHLAENPGMNRSKTVIGRSEHIIVPANDSRAAVPAKVDTGAYSSSIWTSDVAEKNGELRFCFFAPGSPHYTGKVITIPAGAYTRIQVENSFGDGEERYAVPLRIHIAGRTIESVFTLADRSRKPYPILLGRNLLHKGFIVDVDAGSPLSREERRLRKMHNLALRGNED